MFRRVPSRQIIGVLGFRDNLSRTTRSIHQSAWFMDSSKSSDEAGKSGAAKPPSGDDPSGAPGDMHFKLTRTKHPLGDEITKKVHTSYWDNPVPHPIYTPDDLSSVKKTHHDPNKPKDKLALFAVKVMRSGFDFVSRYKGPGGEMTRRDWLNRCIFLESIAGVPGMVAGMARHLRSLRTMQRDYGWIHTLLEEAENERMHLLIFMKLKEPNLFFRVIVIGAQGVFFNMFFLTYLFAPRTCHRFVGYLEEEAVKTYTGLIKDIDDGFIPEWKAELAPEIARRYYKLGDDATVRDVVLCIRADEANHRDVNHTFASIDYDMDKNPFLGKHGPNKK